MKQLIKIFILVFATFILTIACKKQKIPTGDHSFSCYINGKLFLPKGGYDDIYGSYSGLSIELASKYLYISVNNKADYIYINLSEFYDGKHYLVKSIYDFTDYNFFKINHAVARINGKEYISYDNSGWVEITKLDTISEPKDVKGKFEFTLYNENNPNDKLVITKGQFDN